MTIDRAIIRYSINAEYERTHGNLQGCLEFRQLADWLKELKQLREQVKGYNQGVSDVLDKIRAEIDSHCSDNRDRNDGLYIAMKIIDKYIAEGSEDVINVTPIRNEEGMLERHYNTYEITIRCRSKKEYDAVLEKLNAYGEWTPVAQKLPDIHDYTKTYLVTLTNGDVVISRYTETRGRHWWTHYGVVAWMELPDKYKGDAE